MASQQLVPYFGEFLLVPWALELSLIEPCDYACRFCFAILGDRGRKHYGRSTGNHASGVKQALSLLQNAHKRKTLEAFFINNKYPILMSNRTDPFGRKNRVQSLAFIEITQEMGIPLAFQTKGLIKHDLDFDRIMDMIPPSWWYVTISQDDDALRQRIEPGATQIEYRYELIQELTRRGHKVCLGWNPFVPEWVSDFEKFLQRAWDAGAEQIAIQMLHLNDSNVRQMTEREKQDLHGGDLEWWNKIQSKKKSPEDWQQPFRDAHMMASEMGFKHITYDPQQTVDPWEDVIPLYGKTLPTVQQFVAHCHRTLNPGDPVFFDDWLNWCLPRLPDVAKGLGHIIRIKSWGVTKRIMETEGWDKWVTDMDYSTLLRICWEYQERLPSLSPYTNCAFCPAWDEKKNAILDDRGLPVLTFAPDRHPLAQYEAWVYSNDEL
jgi:DNA repair photolyase